MNFKITNDEDDSIKVEIEFGVDSWKELKRLMELLDDEIVKKRWEKKRRKMLSEKIDVTKFMTEFIENYPESFLRFKNKEH